MFRLIIAIFIILSFIGLANGQGLADQGDGLPLKVKPAKELEFKIWDFSFDYIDLQVKVLTDDIFYFTKIKLEARYKFNEAMFNKLTAIAKSSYDVGFASGIKESVKRREKDNLKYGVIGAVSGLVLGVIGGIVVTIYVRR